jgi:hypothetical protein
VTQWVEFEPRGRERGARTQRWVVWSKFRDPDQLGWVVWRSWWRCYVFEGVGGVQLDPRCLREVADFAEARTAEQRATWKRPGRKRG